MIYTYLINPILQFGFQFIHFSYSERKYAFLKFYLSPQVFYQGYKKQLIS